MHITRHRSGTGNPWFSERKSLATKLPALQITTNLLSKFEAAEALRFKISFKEQRADCEARNEA